MLVSSFSPAAPRQHSIHLVGETPVTRWTPGSILEDSGSLTFYLFSLA